MKLGRIEGGFFLSRAKVDKAVSASEEQGEFITGVY